MGFTIPSLIDQVRSAAISKLKEYVPKSNERQVFSKPVSKSLTTSIQRPAPKRASLFSNPLGKLADFTGNVKEAGRLYKKGTTSTLNRQETGRYAQNPVLQTLNKFKGRNKSSYDLPEPGRKTRDKFNISDVFSKGLSEGFQKATGIKSKWAQPLLKEGLSFTQDKLKERKGYTRDEVRDKVGLKLLQEYGVGAKGITRDLLGQRDDKYLDYEWDQMEEEDQDKIIKSILDEKGEKYKKQLEYEKGLSMADRYEALRQQYGPAAADLSPQELEQQKVWREGLKGAIEGYGRGALSGLTVGVSDQIVDTAMKNQPVPIQFQVSGLTKEEKEQAQKARNTMNAVAGAFGLMGALTGGAKTYSAIAGRIGNGLKVIEAGGGTVGKFMAAHPVLTAYTVQNGLEEAAEFGIRKATGQEYTGTDFLFGITTGGIFTRLGIGQVKRDATMKNLERSIADAEIAKGSKLTQDELFNTMLTTKVYKDETLGQMFGEARYAYLKGKKDAGRPGIDEPAPLPQTKKAIAEDVSPYKKAEEYVKEYVDKQKTAHKAGKTPLLQKATEIQGFLKKKFVDRMAPVEDVITAAQKKYGFEILPEKNFADQVDRVLRTTSLATRFIEDNGLKRIIEDAPDLDKLGQYLTARHTKRLETMGIETGRNMKKDQAILDEFKGEYDQYAKAATAYSQKVLDYITKSGLISKADNKALKELYPEYVPINRVFSEFELDKADKGYAKNTIANLSKQRVVEKLKGSKREIENPVMNLLDYTYKAFQQSEKNVAARMLAGYHKLPGLEKYFTEIKKNKPGETPEARKKRIFEGDVVEKPKNMHKLSYLEDGRVKEFEIPKDWEEAVKGMTPDNLGLLGRMMMVPVRLFKGGTTSYNLAFGGSNIVKDAEIAMANSRFGGLAPRNFATGLKEAITHGEFYKKLTRAGAGGTQFDLTRNKLKSTMASIRTGRGGKAEKAARKTVHAFKSPEKFIQSAEDIIGRTEEINRIAVADQTYKKFRDQGMTHERAMVMAVRDYNNVTANFLRGGQLKKMITVFSPYQAAGFAGARSFVRAVKRNPAKMALKVASYMLLPEAMTTTWNLMDPERAEIYKDIRGFEKDNNFIIILPGTTKDGKGKWNVIKIPKAPGISQMAVPVRKELEKFYIEGKGAGFDDFANALLEPASGLDFSNPLNAVMPQMFKPAVEAQANYKFFTGQQLIPNSMKYLPPEEQAFDYTSGTAKKLGELLKISPIQIEHYIKGYLGGVGSQATHYTDKLLSSAGVIPEEQVGGRGLVEDITGRFTKASGGEQASKVYEARGEVETKRAREKTAIKKELAALIKDKDKAGLAEYAETLNDLDRKYLEAQIDKQAEAKVIEDEGISDKDVAINRQTSSVIYEYYKKDIAKALKSDDKGAIAEILGNIDSAKKKETVLDMILENKADLMA